MTTSATAIPRIPLGDAFSGLVDWMRAHLSGVFDAISFLVQTVNDALAGFFGSPSIIAFAIVVGLVGYGLRGWKIGIVALATAGIVAQVAVLIGMPAEYLMIAAFTGLAFAMRGWAFGLFGLLAFVLIGALGQWENAMDTLALVLLAGVIAVVMAIPLGIATALNPAVRRVVEPVLDFMQTLPQFVYLIPAIFFFGVGVVPGAVATIAFAMAPGVRLTALGIEQVDQEVVEAGEAFGASPRKVLGSIQLPLALPTIMAGVNQIIMLGLSMVVIAGMVGAEGLGGAVYTAVTGVQIGPGFEAGLSVVILAIYLDRLTRALADRSAVVRARELANQ